MKASPTRAIYKSLIFNVICDIMAQKLRICDIFSLKSGKLFSLLLALCLLLAAHQMAFAQGRNPYQLPLATQKKHYKQQVDSNNLLQMVRLQQWIPGLRSDIKYATAENFTGEVLYKRPDLYLRKEAATQLKLVADSLDKLGIGLLIFDAYRPYAATLKMWQIISDDRYAANPANGSGHNRGIAVDLTLVNKSTGIALAMPTAFDSFSDSAHYAFTQLDSTVLYNRALLKNVMSHFGFVPLPTEWWHFSLPQPKKYPLMDFRFAQLRRWTKKDKPSGL